MCSSPAPTAWSLVYASPAPSLLFRWTIELGPSLDIVMTDGEVCDWRKGSHWLLLGYSICVPSNTFTNPPCNTTMSTGYKNIYTSLLCDVFLWWWQFKWGWCKKVGGAMPVSLKNRSSLDLAKKRWRIWTLSVKSEVFPLIQEHDDFRMNCAGWGDEKL